MISTPKNRHFIDAVQMQYAFPIQRRGREEYIQWLL